DKLIFINDTAYTLPTIIKVNGKTVTENIFLNERDQLEISTPTVLKDILDMLSLDYDYLLEKRSAAVTFNDQVIMLTEENSGITVNGQVRELDALISAGDTISLKKS